MNFESEYADVWEQRIKEAFKNKGNKQKTVTDVLWNIVNLILFENAGETLLNEVYELFEDKSDFVRLITLLDGRVLKSPTKKELEETLLLALLYYEKEIEKKEWRDIEKSYDFKIPTVKYGIRIRNLDNWIKQRTYEILSKQEQDKKRKEEDDG